MAEAWPGSIPEDVLVSGYDESWADNILESPNDAGRPKRRKRFTKEPRRPFRARMKLTRAQVATLETFYHTTLSDGVKAFTFTHPRTLSSITAYFRAGSPPSTKPEKSGANWSVSFDLEFET